MRLFAAILGSVLLLWGQAMANLAPASAFPAADDVNACACAGCGAPCCCVNAPNSNSPLMPVPPPGGTAHELSASLISSSLAWSLPEPGARGEITFADAPLSKAGVPLFARHCARLL